MLLKLRSMAGTTCINISKESSLDLSRLYVSWPGDLPSSTCALLYSLAPRKDCIPVVQIHTLQAGGMGTCGGSQIALLPTNQT